MPGAMYSAGQCLILCRGIGLAWCGQCVSRHRAAFFTFHFALFALHFPKGHLSLPQCSAVRCPVQRAASFIAACCAGTCSALHFTSHNGTGCQRAQPKANCRAVFEQNRWHYHTKAELSLCEGKRLLGQKEECSCPKRKGQDPMPCPCS